MNARSAVLVLPICAGMVIACAPGEANREEPSADATGEAADATTPESLLIGTWRGGNPTRGSMAFTFEPDGSAIWVVDLPTGPDTMRIVYEATPAEGDMLIDLSGFDHGPLAGLTMYGRAAFDGTDSLRIDFEPGPADEPGGRPADMSSTDVVTLIRDGEGT